MSYDIMPLFSKVFYKNTLDDIEDEQLENVREIIDEKEYMVSNFSDPDKHLDLTTSSVDFEIFVTDKRLKFIKDRILKEFYIFKNEVLRLDKLDFDITTSWVAKSQYGQVSGLHVHHNCFYSGVLYISTDKECGDIFFTDMSEGRFVFDNRIAEYNVFNAKAWRFTPVDKMIIFFPSEVNHKILRNYSHNTRYSLAFNIIPVGTVGEGDSQFQYVLYKDDDGEAS